MKGTFLSSTECYFQKKKAIKTHKTHKTNFDFIHSDLPKWLKVINIITFNLTVVSINFAIKKFEESEWDNKSERETLSF